MNVPHYETDSKLLMNAFFLCHLKVPKKAKKCQFFRRKAADTGEKPPVKAPDNVSVSTMREDFPTVL